MKARNMNPPIQVLIVEDCQADIDLTLEAMESWKVLVHVEVVKDGESALAYLRKQGKYAEVGRPSLVLLDLNLPKVTGHEVLAEIRRDEQLADIPVVILSTSNDERDILGSYLKYANCFITKPVQMQEFFQAIRSIEKFWLQVVELPVKSEGASG